MRKLVRIKWCEMWRPIKESSERDSVSHWHRLGWSVLTSPRRKDKVFQASVMEAKHRSGESLLEPIQKQPNPVVVGTWQATASQPWKESAYPAQTHLPPQKKPSKTTMRTAAQCCEVQECPHRRWLHCFLSVCLSLFYIPAKVSPTS